MYYFKNNSTIVNGILSVFVNTFISKEHFIKKITSKMHVLSLPSHCHNILCSVHTN